MDLWGGWDDLGGVSVFSVSPHPVSPHPVSPPGITNQASIEELSPCEEPPATRNNQNGDVE